MRPGWLAFGVGVVTFVLFSSALSLGFVLYDDPQYVLNNDYVKDGLNAESLYWTFTGFGAVNYHPVTWLSHLADVTLYGLEPSGHHLTSVTLHALNAALVFLVALRLLERRGVAVVIALAFALHPQRVESVAWVSERKDVLSGLFFFLMLLAYVHGHQRNSARWRVSSVVFFILGLLSKPMLVTAPAILVLVDVGFLGRFDGSPRRLLVLVGEKLPLFALSALESWATVLAQERTIAAGAVVTGDMRLKNAATAIVRYLEKFVAPRELVPLYAMHEWDWTWPRVVGSVAVIVVITIVAVLLWRRTRLVLVGWLWFLGMLVPVIGLVQVGGQAMADRYSYLPCIGLLLSLFGLYSLVTSARAQRYCAVFAAAWIALCAGLTRAQIDIWSSTESMWRWTVDVDPYNAGAQAMLASLCLDRGDLACGLEHSTRAMELGAVVPKFHEDFATALLRSGQLREAEAILNLILSEDDQSPVAWRLYGDLERERGDYNAALRRYRHAAVIGEHVDYEIGRCLLELGDVDAAIERLQRAVDRAGDRAAGPLFHLARARHRKGDIAIAAGLLARARTIVVENNDTALLSKIDHELETLRP